MVKRERKKKQTHAILKELEIVTRGKRVGWLVESLYRNLRTGCTGGGTRSGMAWGRGTPQEYTLPALECARSRSAYMYFIITKSLKNDDGESKQRYTYIVVPRRGSGKQKPLPLRRWCWMLYRCSGLLFSIFSFLPVYALFLPSPSPITVFSFIIR